ncbi:MAG: selenocysteine-specific translation elongation factor [Nitrospirae bacterium]|nr:selenocysteine-specific translation elongation factor [Nitrospirota bacterium]
MRHIIMGTAGHIDHGKSSLVKALTGIDPDRLKEEKLRGITIDIGFADLVYPDKDLSVGIVDVPGHEKLVRNMLAGAGGIDIVLMVIAADEGIMPQSREHLAICNLLNIQSGLIAVTKSDLVETEWLDLVTEEVKSFVKGTFLDGAKIIPVSSKSGHNLELLKDAIRDLALAARPKSSDGLFRLPIDRVFTLKGFGTVITGTAISGRVSVDDTIEILPCNIKTKVRGLHSHGISITRAAAGQRVAINLQSVEKEDLTRGDVAVTPGGFSQTKVINAHLSLLDNVPVLKNRSLLHFYSGTSETIARVILFGKDELKPLENSYCQLRLNDAVVVMSGDRYIIRRFSPLETLGGGLVLDPSPARRSRKDGLEDIITLHTGGLEEKIGVKIEQAGRYGISSDSVLGWINQDIEDIRGAVNALKSKGQVIQLDDTLIHIGSYRLLHENIASFLRDFHKKNPIKPGIQKEEVRTHFDINQKLFNYILANSDSISAEKDMVRLKAFSVSLSDGEEQSKAAIVGLLEKNGYQPPLKEELSSALKVDGRKLSDLLNLLIKSGKIVRINESIYLTRSSYDAMILKLRDFFAAKNEMSVAEFRDLLDTSRKYALPILEYLDSNKITLRTGDVRKFLKAK